MKEVKINFSYVSEDTVTSSKLASSVGSGIADVYATPMMVALMENSAMNCLDEFLEDGESSVGIKISTTHVSATPVGMKVKAEAEIKAVDGRKVDFKIIAYDESGVIGEADHTRFVVNTKKFIEKANNKIIV